MVTELRPGVPTAIFGRVIGEVKVRGRLALAPIAEEIKREARANAENGHHLPGTKTPASPGEGPAMISGALIVSIQRTPVIRFDFGWMVTIGVVPNYAPYYNPKRTTGTYGPILELYGCRNGAKYPFLEPAFDMVCAFFAPSFLTSMYGATWARYD